jgi:signal transduction histidine kinase
MRRQLVLLVAATTSLVLVAFLVPLALLVRTVVADRAVSVATQEAQALAPLISTLDPAALELAVKQLNASGAHPITVMFPSGRWIGPEAPRSEAVRLAASGASITADTPAGREILVAVQGQGGQSTVIRSFVPDAELNDGVPRAWMLLALLGLGLLVLSMVVAEQLARALVRPLTEAAGISHQLAGGDLSVRAGDAGPPEVRQVAAGLNLLAGRITELLAHERETVADLAHRLRTPLTVLRVDAESLRGSEDAARITADVEALERTVNDVIHETRRPVREGVVASCDAAEVVRERVAFWAVLAEDQQRPVQVEVAARPLPVRVAAADLAACVDALLANVFAHTPEGTGLAVRLAGRAGGGARLDVEDGGPGFAGDEVVERGRSGAGSTGLGMDIARRTAQASGGALRLGRSPAGGAAVTVELGAPLA